MKRLFFAFAIAGLAISASAQADAWGRVYARPVAIPNSLVARQSDKGGPIQGPVDAPAHVQAPAHDHVPMKVEHDGYPFTSRCGANDNGCCDGVWGGYAKSCGRGWSHGRSCNPCGGKVTGRIHGFGGCGSSCGMTACGNSFGGFGGCGTSGGFSGMSFGFGRSGCGGCGHSAVKGCGCRGGLGHGIHRHGGFRLGGCSTGCTSGCADSGVMTSGHGGCSGCAGHAQHDHVQHDNPVQKSEPVLANPPVPAPDVAPAEGVKVSDGEKSARRSNYGYQVVYPMTGY